MRIEKHPSVASAASEIKGYEKKTHAQSLQLFSFVFWRLGKYSVFPVLVLHVLANMLSVIYHFLVLNKYSVISSALSFAVLASTQSFQQRFIYILYSKHSRQLSGFSLFWYSIQEFVQQYSRVRSNSSSWYFRD